MAKIKEIERTPNPDAMRFVLHEPLTNGVTRSFENSADAASDPLASALFAIDSVINVYYVGKYITVTQDGKAVWSELLRKLAPPIREAETQHDAVEEDDVHASDEVRNSDDPRLAEFVRLLQPELAKLDEIMSRPVFYGYQLPNEIGSELATMRSTLGRLITDVYGENVRREVWADLHYTD